LRNATPRWRYQTGHDAPQNPVRVVASPGRRFRAPGGRGAWAIRALPDLCFGIVSGRTSTSAVEQRRSSCSIIQLVRAAYCVDMLKGVRFIISYEALTGARVIPPGQ